MQPNQTYAPNAETFVWRGPESKVDAVIRRRKPLPKTWWYRSYIDHENVGWVVLYKVEGRPHA